MLFRITQRDIVHGIVVERAGKASVEVDREEGHQVRKGDVIQLDDPKFYNAKSMEPLDPEKVDPWWDTVKDQPRGKYPKNDKPLPPAPTQKNPVKRKPRKKPAAAPADFE